MRISKFYIPYIAYGAHIAHIGYITYIATNGRNKKTKKIIIRSNSVPMMFAFSDVSLTCTIFNFIMQ